MWFNKISLLGKVAFISDTLSRNKSAIEVEDDVLDSIFNIQDKIVDDLRPKLRKVQGYGEIGSGLNDELQGLYKKTTKLMWQQLMN